MTAQFYRKRRIRKLGWMRNSLGWFPDKPIPNITSPNPSGSYPENTTIQGSLEADLPVDWTITGPDAGAVTLTGTDWSVGPTDFETKSSYSWTFTATYGNGNSSDQEVNITITDVLE